MKIRLCEHNKGAEEFVQRLKGQFSDLDIKLKKCAKQCKTCKKTPFAIIDKNVVIADDFEELYKSILKLPT
jgi:uncharacterized protein YuzB (UPF0349 family)